MFEQEAESRKEGSISRVWQIRFALLHSRAPQRQHILLFILLRSGVRTSLLVAGTEAWVGVGVLHYPDLLWSNSTVF